MAKAVFLDRDGTINEDVGLLHSPEQIKLLPKVSEAIKLLNKLNFLCVIVTNQPVVARGLCEEDDVKRINKIIKNVIEKNGATIDAIYYCPHHPEMHDDVPEKAIKYRIECECRKPNTGMLLQAKNDFDLDLKKCFIVGDKTTDIKTGKDAGCKTILVKTGNSGKDRKYDVKPDFVCKDLYESVKLIEELS